MSLDGPRIHDALRDHFQAAGSPERWASDYLQALQYSVRDIGQDLDLATDPTVPTNHFDNIDLDAKYEMALNARMDYYLTLFGHAYEGVTAKEAEDQYEQAIRRARFKRDQDAAAVDEADVIGLGYQE